MGLTKGDITSEGRIIAEKAINTPDWQTAINYIVNDEIYESGTLYRCNTTHTSSTLFVTDSSNWDAVGSGNSSPNLNNWSTINSAQTLSAGNYIFDMSGGSFTCLLDNTLNKEYELADPNFTSEANPLTI